ncbi:HD domain-containing protein [Paradesulfitobacterium aromaticivorans]
MSSMNRVNNLIDHPEFQQHLEKIEELERERKFCKHGFEHGLAVARIANAYLLEEGANKLGREVVYAAALLHDIGRWVEYETGKDHAEASAELAAPILAACGFAGTEIEMIAQGIREHRLHRQEGLSPLGQALALADDWARDCRNCAARTDCYKFGDSMLRITY